MSSESARASSARKWWLLIGGFVVFVVVFELPGRVVRTGPASPKEGSTATADADAAPRSPAPPELRRLDGGGIEIRHDHFRRSTIRLGDEEGEQGLFDCLTRGIEETFGGGTEGWSRRRVRRETQRVQDECLGSVHGIPLPPRPLEPGS